ncbi:hypothetical protein, partial [Sneathiella chinensis]
TSAARASLLNQQCQSKTEIKISQFQLRNPNQTGLFVRSLNRASVARPVGVERFIGPPPQTVKPFFESFLTKPHFGRQRRSTPPQKGQQSCHSHPQNPKNKKAHYFWDPGGRSPINRIGAASIHVPPDRKTVISLR